MNKIRYIFVFSLFILIPVTIYSQFSLIGNRYGQRILVPGCPWCDAAEADRPDVIYIPIDVKIMRLISPSDPDFLADLLWMRACYYFGQHALTNREYPFLFHMLDMITDLSPAWDIPYVYGAVLLPTEAEAIEEGMYLIDKGLKNCPDTWELWFYKGYYLWKNKGDYPAAAKALYIGAFKPKAPTYLASLAATLATKAGQNELARRFVQEAMKNLKDPKYQKVLQRKMKEMQKNE